MITGFCTLDESQHKNKISETKLGKNRLRRGESEIEGKEDEQETRLHIRGVGSTETGIRTQLELSLKNLEHQVKVEESQPSPCFSELACQ